jgi:DNA (cytosine-5)-methyltransferase 1
MIRYIDLFAGLGGIRLGLEQALADLGMDGECVFTSEIKETAIRAYNYNFPDKKIEVTDVKKVECEEITPFNILLGGFPCQAFSNAGSRKGFVDTRGTSFFDIQRILEAHIAHVDGFILENVEGLVTHDKINKSDSIGRTLTIIMDVLNNQLDFNAKYYVLNSADFGVAQKRKRVYIVGCRKRYGDIDFTFQTENHVGVGNLLEHGLPTIDNDFSHRLLAIRPANRLNGVKLKDKRGGETNIHSWELEIKGPVSEKQKRLLNILLCERRKKKWAKIIGIDWMDGMPLTTEQIRSFFDVNNLQKLLDDLTEKKYLFLEHPKQLVIHKEEDGSTWTERVPDFQKPKGYNILTGKLSFEISSFLNVNEPSNTLVAMDMGTIGVVDGDGIRHLTLREGLRLFGYPDSYSLEMFENEKEREIGYDLIGNSVCVPVIREVAKKLLNKMYRGV